MSLWVLPGSGVLSLRRTGFLVYSLPTPLGRLRTSKKPVSHLSSRLSENQSAATPQGGGTDCMVPGQPCPELHLLLFPAWAKLLVPVVLLDVEGRGVAPMAAVLADEPPALCFF